MRPALNEGEIASKFWTEWQKINRQRLTEENLSQRDRDHLEMESHKRPWGDFERTMCTLSHFASVRFPGGINDIPCRELCRYAQQLFANKEYDWTLKAAAYEDLPPDSGIGLPILIYRCHVLFARSCKISKAVITYSICCCIIWRSYQHSQDDSVILRKAKEYAQSVPSHLMSMFCLTWWPVKMSSQTTIAHSICMMI